MATRDDIHILTADELTKIFDHREQVYEIPEINRSIKIRAMTLGQRDQMLAKVTDNGRADGKPDPQKIIRQLVVFGVSEPKITEEMLDDLPFQLVDRIATAVMSLNGMIKGGDVTAWATFRPEPGSVIPIPAGEGSGTNGQPVTS